MFINLDPDVIEKPTNLLTPHSVTQDKNATMHFGFCISGVSLLLVGHLCDSTHYSMGGGRSSCNASAIIFFLYCTFELQNHSNYLLLVVSYTSHVHNQYSRLKVLYSNTYSLDWWEREWWMKHLSKISCVNLIIFNSCSTMNWPKSGLNEWCAFLK